MLCCDTSYQPLVNNSRTLHKDESPSARQLKRANTNADIVQFTTAIFFVVEDEHELTVDVMRLGSMKGAVKVRYFTEDGSAKKGISYEETFGELIFEEDEYRQSIKVKTIENSYWSATMEFKIHLADPDGCNLGHHLHSCRVKIIDTDTFPSSKYEADLKKGEEGMDNISASGLFWEYFKLCFFQVPSVSWRTIMCIIFDQLKNIYRYMTLCLNIYIVDVLCNMDKDVEERLLRPTREQTAIVVGVLYVSPMLVLQSWDLMKAKMDLVGHLRLYLQSSLFRRYLNYSEQSRASVPPEDMQHALSLGCKGAAEGYVKVLHLFQKLGQLAVFTYFTLWENPDAIYLILAMPTLMTMFLTCKSLCEADSADRKDTEAQVLGLAAEVCQRYRLIADYFQRPQMNEIFARKTDELRRQSVPEAMESVNNEYFPKWLGPLFVGVYVAVYAPSVFSNAISLGTFLATIQIMKDISSEFAEAYDIILELTDTFEAIQSLTVFFNKPTDLLMWKKINRERREATRQARDELFKTSGDESKEDKGGKEQALYKTDMIKIRIDGMTFGWIKDSEGSTRNILRNVTTEVDQGKLVAVIGPHGSGKKTLLSLLGHMIFPHEGQIFIPSHLRILHVTQEAYLLNLSPWRNLIFGCANAHSVDPERVRTILTKLEMSATLEMIEPDLQKQATLRESTKSVVAEGSEDEESEDEEEIDMSKSQDDNESWSEALTYSEKVKIHLARALIMNPEVLVLQRPLHHYDNLNADKVLEVLQTHVNERGLALPEKGRRHRRPRTCFLSVERPEHAEKADVVWTINKDGQVETTIETDKTGRFLEKMQRAFRAPSMKNNPFHM